MAGVFISEILGKPTKLLGTRTVGFSVHKIKLLINQIGDGIVDEARLS